MRKKMGCLLSLLLCFTMLASLLPAAALADDAERAEVTVTARGPQNVVIQGEEPTPTPSPSPSPGPNRPSPMPTRTPEVRDIFAASLIQAEVARDFNQEIAVSLRNTAQIPVEYYLTVNNPHSDLSMNFVGEGSERNHGVLLPAGESTAVLNVFAQDAEGIAYNDITLTAHVSGSEFTRTLSLTVTGEELDLAYTVEDIDGGVEITLTNNGADVNSLKVRADDVLSNYASFPVSITNYRLPSDESVEFQVLASGVSGSVSGNILVSGNGSSMEIPVTLLEPEPERVTGRDLALKDNIFRDIQVEEDSLVLSDDGVLSYSFLYGDSRSVPLSFHIRMEGTDEQPPEDWYSGIHVEETGDATVNFTFYMSMEAFAQLMGAASQDSIALMDAETVNGVLVHFGINIELDNWDELVDQFNAAVEQDEELRYISELPSISRKADNIRKSYTATLQMEILLELIKKLQEETPEVYQELMDHLKEEFARQFAPGSVDNPIALFEETLVNMKRNLEKLMEEAYPDYRKPKEDTKKDNPTKKVVNPDYQCTNRGSIGSNFHVEDYQDTKTNANNPRLLDEAVTAADRGIRVFYSGRIYSEDRYVNFEPVDYDLYINGEQAGVTQNSGLSELNIIELDASKILVGRTNTFVRDYRTNPGSHFINTDNEFIIVYPANAILEVTDNTPVEAALPDFDIYKKNIFAYGPNSTYLETPCAGENVLHVSISNRGAYGGYYQIAVSNGDEKILADGEHDFHYLSPFTSETLELPVTLREGENNITVEITDVNGRTHETVTSNNRATMTITARARQIPEITGLAPFGALSISSLDDYVSLTTRLSHAEDVEKVTFYLDGTLAGTMEGARSAYYVNAPITEGEHTVKAEVSYFSGGTASNDTAVVTRETTFTVSVEEEELPWAEVILPEDSDISRYARVSLLRWDADASNYHEADFVFNVEADIGGTYHLFVDRSSANPVGMTLVIYDGYNESLYAGIVGIEGSPISVIANRTLTFHGISFADTDVYVSLPGVRQSYAIEAEIGGTTVNLPALFFESVNCEFFLEGNNSESIDLDFENIDLTRENQVVDILERVTTYTLTFPEASVSASEILLLTYDSEDESYEESWLNYSFQTYAEGGYRLLVVNDSDSGTDLAGLILVVHDAEHEKLYAGTVGEADAPVVLTANRTLTLSDAVFGDTSIRVSIAGVWSSSFTIATENGGSSVTLPALAFDSISGRFQMDGNTEAVQLTLSDINLSNENQSVGVVDKFTIYTFTLPDDLGSNNPFSAYYLYSYDSGSRVRYVSTRMSTSVSSNRITAVLEKDNLYGRIPASASIFLYNGSRSYGSSVVQPRVLLIEESTYTAGMAIDGVTTNRLILTADDTEKLSVTRVTFSPGEFTNSATLYFSEGSGQTSVSCSPATYSCGISFQYDGQSYTTTQAVDLSGGDVTINLSEIALVSTLQVRWDSAYGSKASVQILETTDRTSSTVNDYEAGSLIRLQPGTYNISTLLYSGEDSFEFSTKDLEITAGGENIITIGSSLSGLLLFDDYRDQNNIPPLEQGTNIKASLSDLQDENGNLLIRHGSETATGFVVFSESTGGDIEIPVQFTEGYMSTLNFAAPMSAGSYSVRFRSYAVEVEQAVITASAGNGGTISPNGAVSVNKGGSTTFSIRPNSGYSISQVLVDNASVGAVSTYTFTNVQENHTISATFRSNGNTNSGSRSGSRSGSSTSTSRTEIIIQADHGNVQVTPENPVIGTVVTAIVTPNSGYELDTLTVVDSLGMAVNVTKNNGNYTFTAQTNRVTVNAVFKQVFVVPSPTPSPAMAFIDVEPGRYYTDAVYWAVENSITNGLNHHIFGPNEACTRAQMVTFLWRALGSPDPVSMNAPFTDLVTTAFYYKAVLWAYERGITLGTSASEFSPNRVVSRAQAVTFLYRSSNSPSVDRVNPFTDVAQNTYFYDAVNWASLTGVTLGNTDTTFNPSGTCTRGNIVTFLYRYYVK